MSTDHMNANRSAWDRWAEVHVRSRFYDVPAFEAGQNTLPALDREEVGDVAGRSLLHLQCHFGMDTLSWARLGARVTGLDFSPVAITEAQQLAARTQLDARFVCSNVYDAVEALGGERFDIVYTSYGALNWLPDLKRWGQVVARCLRPGGRVHVLEFHPIMFMLDDALESFAYRYDTAGTPVVSDQSGTYADPAAPVKVRMYDWNHGVARVVTALLEAGLALQSLREHDWSPYDIYPDMHQVAPGRYRTRKLDDKVPYLYSLAARVPG